jgi:hypothetical protein
VNADQALVTGQVISDGSKQTTAGRLLTAGMDRPMGIIELVGPLMRHTSTVQEPWQTGDIHRNLPRLKDTRVF